MGSTVRLSLSSNRENPEQCWSFSGVVSQPKLILWWINSSSRSSENNPVEYLKLYGPYILVKVKFKDKNRSKFWSGLSNDPIYIRLRCYGVSLSRPCSKPFIVAEEKQFCKEDCKKICPKKCKRLLFFVIIHYGWMGGW